MDVINFAEATGKCNHQVVQFERHITRVSFCNKAHFVYYLDEIEQGLRVEQGTANAFGRFICEFLLNSLLASMKEVLHEFCNHFWVGSFDMDHDLSNLPLDLS